MTDIWSKEIGTREILAAYKAECREISRQCEEEGYPAYGENYELRADNLWDEWYEEPFRLARIREKMEKIHMKKAIFQSRKTVYGYGNKIRTYIRNMYGIDLRKGGTIS